MNDTSNPQFDAALQFLAQTVNDHVTQLKKEGYHQAAASLAYLARQHIQQLQVLRDKLARNDEELKSLKAELIDAKSEAH